MGFKADFVEALRSGRYQQGFGSLRYLQRVEDGYRDERECFCAWGVGVDVAIRKGYVKDLTWKPGLSGNYKVVGPFCAGASIYPPDQVEMLLDYARGAEGIVHLNDVEHASFATIADIVEEYYSDVVGG